MTFECGVLLVIEVYYNMDIEIGVDKNEINMGAGNQ